MGATIAVFNHLVDCFERSAPIDWSYLSNIVIVAGLIALCAVTIVPIALLTSLFIGLGICFSVSAAAQALLGMLSFSRRSVFTTLSSRWWLQTLRLVGHDVIKLTRGIARGVIPGRSKSRLRLTIKLPQRLTLNFSFLLQEVRLAGAGWFLCVKAGMGLPTLKPLVAQSLNNPYPVKPTGVTPSTLAMLQLLYATTANTAFGSLSARLPNPKPLASLETQQLLNTFRVSCAPLTTPEWAELLSSPVSSPAQLLLESEQASSRTAQYSFSSTALQLPHVSSVIKLDRTAGWGYRRGQTQLASSLFSFTTLPTVSFVSHPQTCAHSVQPKATNYLELAQRQDLGTYTGLARTRLHTSFLSSDAG